MEMINHDNVHLCSDTFGNATNPVILLIMGAGCSMIWWEEPFCEMLAGQGFFVIRYDNRDTGKSSCYPVGTPGYTFEEMSDDAITVLDAYGVGKAIVMGMSMGGMLTQMIALRHPERVCGIVLLSTMYFAEGAESLPYSTDEVNAFFAEMAEAEPVESRDELVEQIIRQWSITAKSSRLFDEKRIRALAEMDANHADCYASTANHAYAQVTGNELGRIAEINVPALVIHGTEDAVIPFPHGEMLAKTIPDARLCVLEGAGHELHPLDYETVVSGIINRLPTG